MSSSATLNWRTINIDALDPDSATNFDLATLTPGVAPVAAADVQSLGQQCRQLLRGGDAEGALRGALEGAPYGGDGRGKEMHLATVTEILQSIRQADMSPMLGRIAHSDGGTEMLDALMKYLYKGMSLSHPPSTTTSTSTAGGSSAPSTPSKQQQQQQQNGITPQATGTGFSQVMHARNLGGAGGGGPEGAGQAMSVLLSWHEKLVEIAGPGSIMRVMTDRRTV